MHALLGIDLGTTGVKAALFSAEDGHVLSSAFVAWLVPCATMSNRPMCAVSVFLARCMASSCWTTSTRSCGHASSGLISAASPNVAG